MNKEKAFKATRRGGIAGFIIAALTSAITCYAISTEASTVPLSNFNDGWLFVDVAIYLFGSLMLFTRQSRVAAVMLLGFYLTNLVLGGIETNSFPISLPSLIFMYFFVTAAWGAFVFQNYRKQENPDKRMSKLVIGLSVPVVMVVGLVMGLGVAVETGMIPSTEVVAGSKLRDRDIQRLRDNDIISSQETVAWFFSDGFLSILSGGSVLTDKHVISYSREGDEFLIDKFSVSEVAGVQLISAGDALNYSSYELKSSDGYYMELWLAGESSDALFIDHLNKQVSGGGYKDRTASR